MAVYTVRIESDADWNVVELLSAATWARGPGRTLRYEADAADAGPTRLEIDDRTIRFGKRPGACGTLTLVVQIATSEPLVALHTDKSASGTMRITSAADSRVNDCQGEPTNPHDPTLCLDPAAAARTGGRGGDPTLA